MKQLIRYEGNTYSLIYHDDLINRLVQQSGTFFEQWLLDEIKDKVTSFDFVIDVGANVGNHSFFFKNICKANRIVCFEPLDENINLLKQNCEDVEINEVALSDVIGDGLLQQIDSMDNNSGTARVSNWGRSIKLTTLDSFKFNNVTFIKIDVEGHELNVLRGAMETINKYKPDILIEIHLGVSLNDVLNILVNYTYEKIGHEEHFLLKHRG